MSKIHIILTILLLVQPALLFAQETPVSSEGGEVLPLSSGSYSGLTETTYSEPNWVLAISDSILREDLCVASDPDFPYDWYEKVFNPCYKTGDTPELNRYWSLESCAETGQAFPMSAFGPVGTGTLDSLYVREGVGFQLYGPDEQPYGPGMVGPKYVSIDHWRDTNPAPDGFEPGTFFVHGEDGALKDYSIIVYPNSLELAVDLFEDPNCVSEFDYMTYTIFYTPGKCEYGPVQVTDYLPAEVDFDEAIPDTGIYDPNNHTYTWNIGTLEPGETGYVTLSVVVNGAAHPGRTIINQAIVEDSNNWNSATLETDVCCGELIYVDDTADGHNTGASWANAYNDLQSAFIQAEAACGSKIWVAAGQYTPSTSDDFAAFYLISGVGVYGGFAGYETRRQDRDFISNETYLTGNGFVNRVVKAENVGHTAVLDGFIIINAAYDGISCDEADPNIVNCIIADNSSYGVRCSSGSDPIISRCTITGNNRGIDSFSSSPTISNCIITENDYYGIICDYGSFTITSNKIYDNNKNGIVCSYTPTSSTITNNQIYGNGENGIFCSDSSSVIKNNWVHHNGESGIDVNRVPAGQALIIRNNTLVYNSGVGISKNFWDSTNSVPTITNCIFLGNLGGDLDENYTASYSYFDGGEEGQGNIKSDPNNPPFAYSDPELYNYHLDPNSVCIDVGDSTGISQDEKDIDGDSRILDGDDDETPEVDMGADESACDDVENDLDFNGDGIIDSDELFILSDTWLRDAVDPNWNPQCDFNDDDFINFVDFAVFAKEWLWEACWRESGTGIWMMMGAGGGMYGMAGGESMLISETAPVAAAPQQQAIAIQPEPSIAEQIEQIKELLDWLYEIKDEIDEKTWLNLVTSLEERLKDLEDNK